MSETIANKMEKQKLAKNLVATCERQDSQTNESVIFNESVKKDSQNIYIFDCDFSTKKSNPGTLDNCACGDISAK